MKALEFPFYSISSHNFLNSSQYIVRCLFGNSNLWNLYKSVSIIYPLVFLTILFSLLSYEAIFVSLPDFVYAEM